ncbi:hypothetical protein FJM67_12475 [Maribrevibacterium harenarium]|uniref:Uncharacterized protein n=1 Tax=Maribrevibacterium harenarium TaxID=2589817 RepID=A0A501WKQ1_9GAMM|nr:hypothetical protein [Maribrevibacterium harenarium]TPE49005.1 hypothetical protein FJM67_12475 [Maribrevibacterium harenarium]
MTTAPQIDFQHLRSPQKALLFRARPSLYLRLFNQLLDNCVITTPVHKFLSACCEVAYQDGEDVYTSPESYILVETSAIESHLKQKGIAASRGTMISRHKALVSLGIATNVIIPANGHSLDQRKHITMLATPLEIEANILSKHEANADEEDAVSDLSDSENDIRLLDRSRITSRHTINKLKTDRAAVIAKPFQYSPLAWPLNTRQAKVTSSSVEIFIKKCKVLIKSTVDAETGLATVEDDLPILNIILNIVNETIKEQRSLGIEQPANEFIIDVVDIADIDGKANSGSVRNQITRSLIRLNRTNNEYHIPLNNSGDEARRFLGLGGTSHYYNKRFLTELEAQFELDEAKLATPRWYRISLDNDTYKALLEPHNSRDTQILYSHSELFSHSSGVIYLLYQFLNLKIGRTVSPIKKVDPLQTYSIEQLHDGIAPLSPFGLFQRIFDAAIKKLASKSWHHTWKWQYNGTNSFTALGYKMEWLTRDEKIISVVFSRDRRDFLTGDNSANNKRIRSRSSQKKELSNEQVPIDLYVEDS